MKETKNNEKKRERNEKNVSHEKTISRGKKR